MEITSLQCFFLFIISFIIGIGSILEEFQLHRPLISCPLIGLALGNLENGIIIGSILEVITLGWVNIGTKIAPDVALVSIISIILVTSFKINIGTGIMLSIPLSYIGQILNIFLRTFNIKLQKYADRFAEIGNLKFLTFIHILAMTLYAIRTSVSAFVVIFLLKINLICKLINSIPENVMNGLNITSRIIVIISYAMILNMIKVNHLIPFFYLGFIVAAFSNFNLISLSIIGLIIAVLYVQMDFRIHKIEEENRKLISEKKNSQEIDNELD